MSFLIQRIVNRYPHWSKIRQDPSTLGQRLIEPFAETFEALQANQLRLDDELHLLRYWTGLGQLWNILLEEEDFFPRTRNTSGGLVLHLDLEYRLDSFHVHLTYQKLHQPQ